jgi:hypothetical protein
VAHHEHRAHRHEHHRQVHLPVVVRVVHVDARLADAPAWRTK